jgi:hypothetical protein
MIRMKPFFALAVLLGSLGPAIAAEPPAHIDLGKLPPQAKMVEEVIVPVPSEIFGVLDKLGSPNWHDVLRSKKVTTRGERPQAALLLGVVIAEGFIAVEAQESEEVKKIGRDVLDLSIAIGVRKSVNKRTNSIREAADKKDWQKVRTELDGAMQEVKQAMIELQDEQLAQLVSLGGWLRGTEALSTVVLHGYSNDSAELLHQPTLLDFFQQQLDHLDPRLKRNPVVAKISKRLPEIKPLLGKPEGDQIPEKSVQKINEITQDLVKAISARES